MVHPVYSVTSVHPILGYDRLGQKVKNNESLSRIKACTICYRKLVFLLTVFQPMSQALDIRSTVSKERTGLHSTHILPSSDKGYAANVCVPKFHHNSPMVHDIKLL